MPNDTKTLISRHYEVKVTHTYWVEVPVTKAATEEEAAEWAERECDVFGEDWGTETTVVHTGDEYDDAEVTP